MILQILAADERPHSRLGGQFPVFPAVSALYRLKSCSSVSVSMVDFSIANTDRTNDNERDCSEHLEVW